MARSLIGILRQLQEANKTELGFSYFYDVEHINPGDVWHKVLDSQAGKSVLVALRTEAYESRYWCRREFLSAESSGMPIIAVDLRRAQFHDSAILPFDSVPTVRVHDGNVVRVILHAMATQLRALRMKSFGHERVKVLPHRPSVYSLNSARQEAKSRTIDTVAYPGPRLSDVYKSAVEPILVEGELKVSLVAFDELENL